MNTHYVDQDISYGSSTGRSNHGLFDVNDRPLINVPGYYLPRAYDFSVIMGPTNASVRSNSPATKYIEEVRFPGEIDPVLTQAVYFSNTEDVVYGLRFYQCDGSDKLTAYRYRAFDLPTERGVIRPNARLEVTSMFLGSSFTGDIQTISNPSFWAAANSNNSITRVFPMVASFLPTPPVPQMLYGRGGIHMTYHGETRSSFDFSTNSGLSLRSSISEPYGRDNVKEAVRLMKNEFKTAQ